MGSVKWCNSLANYGPCPSVGIKLTNKAVPLTAQERKFLRPLCVNNVNLSQNSVTPLALAPAIFVSENTFTTQGILHHGEK